MRLTRCCAALLLVLPLNAYATLIHVLPDGTGDVPTIADALAMAVAGDVVSLGPGVYYEHDLVIGLGVQLVSDTGDPATTAIDSDGLGRCLIGAGGGPQVVRGVTLRNGVHASDGGLVLLSHTTQQTSRFEQCVFRDGSANRGGAVAVLDRQRAQFAACSFFDNEAVIGGAIYTDVFVEASSCEFRANAATSHGGAVFAQKSFRFGAFGIWAGTSTFLENSAGGDGGAIHSAGEGEEYFSSAISQCDFSGNIAGNGGALRVGLYDCVWGNTFLDNHASDRGGAIYLVGLNGGLSDDCDRFDVNLVAHNTATRGGAYAFSSSGILLSSSTFFANAAPDGAQFWMSPGSQVSLYQCIVSFGEDGAAAAGPSGSAGLSLCSDVFGNAGGDYVGPFAEEASTGNNISADPLFCNAEAGDFSLQESSPCLPPAPSGCPTNRYMGRFSAGCPPISVDEETWGRIKARWMDDQR